MKNNGKRILVVDDDQDMCALLTESLRGVGYGAASCQSAETALAMLKLMPPPDLLVVDLRMPDMSGWELIEAVRSDPRCTGLPVVILSALVTPDIASRLNAAAFVRKPFQFPDLAAAVDRLVSKQLN